MSAPDPSFGPPRDDAEHTRLGELLAEVFAFPAADAPAWLASSGAENHRVLRDAAGALVAGLVLLPMGQYWGGRSVRAVGFAGVGVAPVARGTGAGTRLMTGALAELRAKGFPLALLYPATQPLYRKVGFEQAGVHVKLRGSVDALPRLERALPMRALGEDDLGLVRGLYAEQARRRAGWLDRGPYVWNRVRNPRGLGPTVGYLAGPEGAPEGYVLYARPRQPGWRQDLTVTDLVATTPRALARLVTFLADQAPIAESVTWAGGVDDPVLGLVREQYPFESKVAEQWMLRLLDVGAALSARGWPAGLRGELHLELTDALFPANAGPHVLEVSGGEGRVRAGGEGTLRLDVRALASLYAGHRGAHELARMGQLHGPQAALDVADALFAGRPPSMPDMF